MKSLILIVFLFTVSLNLYSQSYYDSLKEIGLDENTIDQYKTMMTAMGVSESELQKFSLMVKNAEEPGEIADAMTYLYRLMKMDESTITMMRNMFLKNYQTSKKRSSQKKQKQYDSYSNSRDTEAKSQAKKNYDLCNEDDPYTVPEALRIDVWNKPVNEIAFMNYIRANGKVLYNQDGLKFYYIIERAITQDGLKRKICQVEKGRDRNRENNYKKLYWYHLYILLENNSSYEINFTGFPCYSISMLGEDTFNDCSSFLCAEAENPYTHSKHADRFGSHAETKLSASPYKMGANSRVYDFKGAWHYSKPSLKSWNVSSYKIKKD